MLRQFELVEAVRAYDPTADEAQLRYVKHIERAGWHLLEMIEDVLDFGQGGTLT